MGIDRVWYENPRREPVITHWFGKREQTLYLFRSSFDSAEDMIFRRTDDGAEKWALRALRREEETSATRDQDTHPRLIQSIHPVASSRLFVPLGKRPPTATPRRPRSKKILTRVELHRALEAVVAAGVALMGL